jgi:hypothetical protein
MLLIPVTLAILLVTDKGAKIRRHCNHDVVSESFVPERVPLGIAADVQAAYEADPVGPSANTPGYRHHSKTTHFQLLGIKIYAP